MRWFLHIDMDAFYASVEQVLDPSLKGKAVIVGGRSGRGVVTSASYEARQFGVHSAMPGFQAKKLCPHGIFLANRHRSYAEFSKRVFAILRRYSPEVRALSIDEACVDLTGTDRLFGPPLSTADAIVRRIEDELGLPCSGGLSTSKVVAKIAATLAKPHGLAYVPAGSEPDFLAPLSVAMIPGVGPKAQAALQRQNITTIGDLLARDMLAARYLDIGAATAGSHCRDHSIGNETTLDRPAKTISRMEAVLWELAEEVGARLRGEKLFARCITVKIRYPDFRTVTRSRTLAAPTCFDREIFSVASELLRIHLQPGKAIRLLGVSASALQSRGWQEPLLEGERRGALEKLYRGIDRLRGKYGDDIVGAATPRRRIG
jgi:DNA polymerase-4